MIDISQDDVFTAGIGEYRVVDEDGHPLEKNGDYYDASADRWHKSVRLWRFVRVLKVDANSSIQYIADRVLKVGDLMVIEDWEPSP